MEKAYFLIKEKGNEIVVQDTPFEVIPEGCRTEEVEVVSTDETTVFRVVEYSDPSTVHGVFEANTTERCFEEVVGVVKSCDGYDTEMLREVLFAVFDCEEDDREEKVIWF